jgi:hypothetical protein
MSRKYRPAVSPMFAEGQDLPLFSGTPIEVEEKPWNPLARPEPEAPSVDMFSEPPAESTITCGHTLDLTCRAVPGGYQAECDTCGARGPVRRRAQLAKDSLTLQAAAPEPVVSTCRHLGNKIVRPVYEDDTRYYVASCQGCGVRGQRRKTQAGAKTALVND